jgi:nudix-type nucleoside diphosphatase (YffH/AdpP family)
MSRVFFYGSLRDRQLTEIVLGRPVAEGSLIPARAPGYATRRMSGEAYPLLLPVPGAHAEGVVLTDAGPTDLDRLAFFEEAEYGLVPIRVETAEGPVEAVHFRATDKRPGTDLPWDFAHWQGHDRAVAIEAARELMGLYGQVPVEDIDLYWGAIMVRARQRARAAAETPRLGGLRTAFGPADLEILARERPYTGFLAVEELRLRHRRFDGGWSAPLGRTAVLWGDAVTVLPYDPRRDRLLLIEQFRPGPAARGDPNPWCIEVVAGRIDTEETAEATARREAVEEAGVRLGRMREIGAYYTTGGLAGERITGFVGEADLPETGSVAGLGVDGEHEDIRAVLKFKLNINDLNNFTHTTCRLDGSEEILRS